MQTKGRFPRANVHTSIWYAAKKIVHHYVYLITNIAKKRTGIATQVEVSQNYSFAQDAGKHVALFLKDEHDRHD